MAEIRLGACSVALAVVVLAGCKRTSSPSATQQQQQATAADEREVYCLVLQARLLTIRSLLSPAMPALDDNRDLTSEVLALLKADENLSKTRLPDLYAETLALIDAHRTYLSEIDQLSRSLKAREESDRDAALRKAIVEGATKHAFDERQNDDSSFSKNLKDSLSSTITGFQTYAEEEKRLKQLREQDREGKLAAVEDKHKRALSDFAAQVQALASVFSKSLRTPEKEFGLTGLLDDIAVYRQQDARTIAKAKQSWA